MNHWDYYDRIKAIDKEIQDLVDEREWTKQTSIGNKKKRLIVRTINLMIHKLTKEKTSLVYPGIVFNVSEEVKQSILKQVFETNKIYQIHSEELKKYVCPFCGDIVPMDHKGNCPVEKQGPKEKNGKSKGLV